MKASTFHGLTNFDDHRVLVVGDVMLDKYVWGEAKRVSPEAPVPVVEFERVTHALGGAANVAANVASLGGKALLLGVVGDDAEGAIVRQELSRQGVEDGLFVDPDRPTTLKTRIIAHGQHIARVDRETRTPLCPTLEKEILARFGQRIEQVDIVVLSDYAKGLLTATIAEGAISMSIRAGKQIIVAPKGHEYGKYLGASLVVANVQEARQALSRSSEPPEDITEVGWQLVAVLEGCTVLITRGHEGMMLFQENSQEVHIPATARHVYDVTGAGDTVVATLALALASQIPLEQAGFLAAVAAGLVVGKVGTEVTTTSDILRELKP